MSGVVTLISEQIRRALGCLHIGRTFDTMRNVRSADAAEIRNVCLRRKYFFTFGRESIGNNVIDSRLVDGQSERKRWPVDYYYDFLNNR